MLRGSFRLFGELSDYKEEPPLVSPLTKIQDRYIPVSNKRKNFLMPLLGLLVTIAEQGLT